MKALRIRRYGGNEVLQVEHEAPKPSVGLGQVLVEVHAAAINPIDWKIRSGYLKDSIALPITLGGDFAGTVAEVGDAGADLKVGDRVYGYGSVGVGGSGSFAEWLTAKRETMGPPPQTVDMVEAAALPLVGVSAIQAIEGHLELQRGQQILILGGAGAIGSTAVQLARSLGAYVAATASGDDRAYVLSLGADEVIDYKKETFHDRPKYLKHFDAVFDTVGGQTTERAFMVLRPGGRLVSMLGQPDEARAKEYQVTAIGQLTRVTSAALQRLAHLVDNGTIKIRVARTYPLEKAGEAFQLVEHGRARGKVVLEMKGG